MNWHYRNATKERICGVEPWGTAFEIFEAPDDDLRGVGAITIGFVLEEEHAKQIVEAHNK